MATHAEVTLHLPLHVLDELVPTLVKPVAGVCEPVFGPHLPEQADVWQDFVEQKVQPAELPQGPVDSPSRAQIRVLGELVQS